MNPVIGAVVAIAIVVTSTAMVMSTISDVVKQGEDAGKFNRAKQLMSDVDMVVRELMYESTGAQRIVKLDAKDGQFIVSEKEDKIKYQLEPDIRIYQPGTRFKEGNLVITSGPFLEAYEADINSDNITDLVVENDAMLFAIKKTGNSTNYAELNTSGMITLMRNKKLGIDIVPKSGILIDGTSDYGNGYTELIRTGDALLSSGIRVVMNSTYGYEAIFTAGAGSDFVELEVRHIG